jgi:uncharacterized protein YggT (Ycf19 family)
MGPVLLAVVEAAVADPKMPVSPILFRKGAIVVQRRIRSFRDPHYRLIKNVLPKCASVAFSAITIWMLTTYLDATVSQKLPRW